jgi:hypothetical protein
MDHKEFKGEQIMEPADIARLKNRAEDVLRSFYGYNVWDVAFTSFTSKDDKYTVEGQFFEDLKKTMVHKFTMVLDGSGKLHDCKIV